MRGLWESNSPFGGHFGPQFAGMGRPAFGCPFRGDSSDQDRRPGFGPFRKPRFDQSPERHCHREPVHPRWGPFEHGHRGCGRCHCCGPHNRGCRHERSCHSPGTDRPHPWFGRNADQHCCGRCGPSNCSGGSDYHRSECCHHASTRPCCYHKRPCHDNGCEERARHAHCEKCCENEPCCGGNKEDFEPDSSVESETENVRDNKIQLVILWLFRELFWKTLKGRHLSDNNMETIITSTTVLQRSLELEELEPKSEI